MTMRIAIVHNASRDATEAIRDNSHALADALRDAGHDAEAIAVDGSLPIELAGRDLVVLQYVPSHWGTRGFAPRLVATLWRLRRRRDRPRIVLVVHEPYIPLNRLRALPAGLWQRAQLLALRAAADAVLVTIERWAALLADRRPRRPTSIHPVGSNLPDRRSSREEARRRIGAGDDLVVTAFWTGESGRSPELVEAALERVASGGRRVVFLNLGAGAPPIDRVAASVQQLRPGRLPRDELADLLSASDIVAMPYVSGATTRRTTLMAALQHGLPVVSTDGPHTDTVLRSSAALRFAPPGDAEQFADEVAALADDPAARTAVGHAARLLYEERFDWPLAAARIVEESRS